MFTPRPLDWLLLAALVMMWGSSFLLTKIALSTLPPMTIVGGRLLIAAIVLLGVVYGAGKRLTTSKKLWSFLVVIAVIGNCLPFSLISWGQQQIDSGVAGILMAVMPLTTLFLAHFFVAGESIKMTKLVGFSLGFVGIVVLMGKDAINALQGSDTTLLAELAVLGGAFCYAVNTIISRRRPKGDAVVAAAGVTLVASSIMLPSASMLDAPWQLNPSLTSLIAVTVLGITSTGIATIIYFKLIESAGPTFLSLINYFIPLWAVTVGALFLGERPGWNALAALILILSGVALSQLPATPLDAQKSENPLHKCQSQNPKY
jgi:drug/metabolite transporter (DMT)-like permease